jgi:isoleucyl-tRNA synthetase
VAERLYLDLVTHAEPDAPASVHLADFPVADTAQIDTALEQGMALVMQAVSLGRAARASASIKVRQPVARMVVVVGSQSHCDALGSFSELVADEVNAKSVRFSTDGALIQELKVVPHFPKLGPVFGKRVNEVAGLLRGLSGEDAARFKADGKWRVHIEGHEAWVDAEMVDFLAQAAEGWAIASEGNMTAAVDVRLTDDLVLEGLARELVNRIQNMRKEADFQVTDRIVLDLSGPEKVMEAFERHRAYILDETLTLEVTRTGAPGEHQKRWPLAGGEAVLSVARAQVAEKKKP